jgi:transcription antitermination factor NusG
MVSGKAARYAPGVKDFVNFGSCVPEVETEVIQALRDRCTNGIAEIQKRICEIGERVMIREGALSGLEAIFEQEMGGGQRVAVLLEILGRRTRVVLSSEMIDPM